MKNTYGSTVQVTLFGESHGSWIGAVIDGMAPGIPVDPEYIARQLSLRRPQDALSTKRVEPDEFQIVSGVFAGKTTGTPLCILIPNEEQNSRDYAKLQNLARPGHADYTAYLKYHGFADYRGGGHFSGRLTAALTAAGAVAGYALLRKGIRIRTHILSCAGIRDRSFEEDLQASYDREPGKFPVLDEEAGRRMQKEIEKARNEKDSVGGILETLVTGMPAGVGEPWFDSAESLLSHMLFSVPAVKGVEFGAGFSFAEMRGSKANDPFRVKGDRIETVTNHNGGINGGITNGMPLLFRCAVKPTPSISIEQETVDFKNRTNETIRIEGRHDPAIVHRAAVVIDSVTALVLCDMLCGRYGTDWLGQKE